MQYHTVFEFGRIEYKWNEIGLLILISLMLLLGIVVSLRRAVSGVKNGGGRIRIFIDFFAGAVFCPLFLSFMLYGLLSDYHETESVIESGKLAASEGKVDNFTMFPSASNDKKEKFCVAGAGKCFDYQCFHLSSDFDTCGLVHIGLPVRVTYVDNTIIKLEVGIQSH